MCDYHSLQWRGSVQSLHSPQAGPASVLAVRCVHTAFVCYENCWHKPLLPHSVADHKVCIVAQNYLHSNWQILYVQAPVWPCLLPVCLYCYSLSVSYSQRQMIPRLKFMFMNLPPSYHVFAAHVMYKIQPTPCRHRIIIILTPMNNMLMSIAVNNPND